MLSHQQIFDIGVKGVRSQKYHRSVNEFNSCKYNHSDGVRHCALGWVFAYLGLDNKFVAEYEGTPIDQMDWFKQFTNLDNISCLWEFQQCHDNINDFDNEKERKEYFEGRVKSYAENQGLVYTAP